MRKEYIDAFRECTISNGELYLPGVVLPKAIELCGDKLRRAIQVGEVPHCKVIGVLISTGEGVTVLDSYISKRSGISRSYAELFTVFEDLIVDRIDGNVPSNLADKSVDGNWGYMTGYGDVIKTDSPYLLYTSKGMKGQVSSLIPDQEIIRLDAPGATINFIVSENIKNKEFAEVGVMLKNTEYVPVAQSFNLTRFLAVRRYVEGDTCLKLMYKTKINEQVLQNIIRNWAYSSLD